MCLQVHYNGTISGQQTSATVDVPEGATSLTSYVDISPTFAWYLSLLIISRGSWQGRPGQTTVRISDVRDLAPQLRATRSSEFPSEDLLIFVRFGCFTGCFPGCFPVSILAHWSRSCLSSPQKTLFFLKNRRNNASLSAMRGAGGEKTKKSIDVM